MVIPNHIVRFYSPCFVYNPRSHDIYQAEYGTKLKNGDYIVYKDSSGYYFEENTFKGMNLLLSQVQSQQLHSIPNKRMPKHLGVHINLLKLFES